MGQVTENEMDMNYSATVGISSLSVMEGEVPHNKERPREKLKKAVSVSIMNANESLEVEKIEQKMFRPRAYQLEMLRESMKRNIIAAVCIRVSVWCLVCRLMRASRCLLEVGRRLCRSIRLNYRTQH